MEDRPRQILVGVDIGGTFTDIALIDNAAGRVRSTKTLTTPADPAQGVLDGIAKVLAQGDVKIEFVNTFVHGTTLATNAIIERKGAATALLATKGFRDLLETGTELRYDQYDLAITFPRPLVPRRLRFGVSERTRYDGEVLEELSESDVRDAVQRIASEGIQSVAVCFLHAYANPENELAALRLIAEQQPGLRVSLSSSVLPQVGEYGRISTTVVNAYVQPLVERYLADLEDALTAEGSRAAFFVMGSSGGTLSVDVAKQFPVRLVESGPAAGACVASYYGQLTQSPEVLALDMGGTTAKICLIRDGQPTRTSEFEVARLRRFQKGSGLLLKVPAVDLIEIGAGGGSIARVDKLGLLAVGPESAAAHPGPACYARGGEQPTVTDADLVLGYLNHDYFLGGEMQLDLERAALAIQHGVAEPLSVRLVEAARSVYELVNENMANAATVYAAEQGIDLRSYSLFAFGGAAPAHAWDVAHRLRMRRVVVPFFAGVLSALGCVLAPLTFDFVLGHMRALEDVDWRHINDSYAEMERQGRKWLADAGVRDGITVSRSADMRYLGQRYEVTVSLPGEWPLSESHVPAVAHEFYNAYRRQYGREIHEVPVEAVTWRLTVAGPRPEVDLRWRESRVEGDRDVGLKGRRPVFFADAGGHLDSCVYDRYALAPGARFLGPAVVEDRESTTVVPPGAEARVDEFNSLVIELEAHNTTP
jgi:N-methylhydantoinase A